MNNFIVMGLLLAFSCTSFAELHFRAITKTLDENVPNILKTHGAPGAAIAIVEQDKILGFKFYGFSNVEKQSIFTQNVMFNVGSVSKVATAWGVMQLVQDGAVNLDQPINTYLKRWKIPDSEFGTDKVTLRNIMSHTSGLSLGPYQGWDKPAGLSIADSLNGQNNGAGEVKLIHEPDTKWSYSGGGYSVIQLLIEDVSGQSFNDYMIEKVFNPLGMNTTTFDVLTSTMQVSATPYDQDGNPTSMLYFTATAAAGMHTTTHDMALFTLTILKNETGMFNGTKILSAELINTMIQPVDVTGGRWSMSYVVDADNQSLGFAGFNRGWIALTRAVVGSNYGYVILINSSIGAVSNEIDSLILKTASELKIP